MPIAVAVLILIASCAFADTPQEHVHSMSHSVMPFDMSKTVHIFRMTVEGGAQRVEVRDPAMPSRSNGYARISHEAAEFAKGNFGDPAHLHGASMPGLSELTANPSRLTVTFADTANGGEIRFVGADIQTITAIHRWFGAQLSEHGADAVAE